MIEICHSWVTSSPSPLLHIDKKKIPQEFVILIQRCLENCKVVDMAYDSQLCYFIAAFHRERILPGGCCLCGGTSRPIILQCLSHWGLQPGVTKVVNKHLDNNFKLEKKLFSCNWRFLRCVVHLPICPPLGFLPLSEFSELVSWITGQEKQSMCVWFDLYAV